MSSTINFDVFAMDPVLPNAAQDKHEALHKFETVGPPHCLCTSYGFWMNVSQIHVAYVLFVRWLGTPPCSPHWPPVCTYIHFKCTNV